MEANLRSRRAPNLTTAMRDACRVPIPVSARIRQARTTGTLDAAWRGVVRAFLSLLLFVSTIPVCAQPNGHTPGSVIAWGENSHFGELNMPAGLSGMIAVAARAYHCLALRADGTVVAWGRNYDGESNVPVGLNSVTAIAAGARHSLALTTGSTVVAWGDTPGGKSSVPNGLTSVIAIAAGDDHSLALKKDGTIVAWGANFFGECDVPASLKSSVAIGAGSLHSLAVRPNGTVVAWGFNDYGQCNVPPGLSGVVAVAAGSAHNLALKADGTVVAWGNNDLGQCTVPSGLNGVVAIAASSGRSLALKSDGTVVAWGFDYHGTIATPAGLNGVISIATGSLVSLAVVADSSAKAGPRILVSPSDSVLTAGSEASISFSALGTMPLTYQWRKNGVDIAGATAANLILHSVTVGDSGKYSVLVRNAYGSAISDSANLAVLADGANGRQPVQPALPVPPVKAPSRKGLIVVTHGCLPGPQVQPPPQWVSDMCKAIESRVTGDWQVMPYFWTDQAWASTKLSKVSYLWNLEASVMPSAKSLGIQLGTQLAAQAWEHIHFIGHSAGAKLIQTAADTIRSLAPATETHTTFLDPYLDLDYNGHSWYGANADWADCYYALDTETRNFTDGPLAGAYNVDVTWVDPDKTLNPIACASITAESTPPVLDMICSHQAVSSHEWPHQFYLKSIQRSLDTCASSYGFSLSKEGGDWSRHDTLKPNPIPAVPCGETAPSQKPFPINLGAQLPIDLLPSAASPSGVNLYSGGGATFVTGPTQPGPHNRVASASGRTLKDGTPTTVGPVWLAVGLSITNSADFIQFDAVFTDTKSAEGLLSVYWNTNQIGMVDERVATSGLETYRFALPETVSDGLYTLSFRLDAFGQATTSLMVTNVATGFVGLTEPVRLDLAGWTTNDLPVLKLTASPGYNYLV